MNLVGIMPVRNEDWILGLSARVALMWCDRLVILNHASTDGTERITDQLMLEEPDGRLRVEYIDDPTWHEMEHRQTMLEWARVNIGDWTAATHIALIDADEILTGNLLGSIRVHIAALNIGQMLTLPLYNLRGGLNRYHLNGIWGQRIVSVAFKDVNTAAFKGNKFHHREPQGVQWRAVQPVSQGGGGVMHLWGASERRLIAKHALYKCTERLRFPEKPVAQIERTFSWAIKGDPIVAQWGTPETWTYGDVPAAWWSAIHYGIGKNPQIINLEAEPWQEQHVRELVREHGRERFEGLDLFGVA